MIDKCPKNADDQNANQDQAQNRIETLLDLSIKWNSLEGVKQVLKSIKEPIQVSPFSRLLSVE